jgi:uncharacterized protein YndB with AHSA1/START domain
MIVAVPHHRVSATTSAPAHTVWRLLVDGRSWPRWASGLDELVEERSSGLDPDGHDDGGAVRAYRTGRVVTGERITELVRDRRLAYESTFNFSMKDHRAVVELEPLERHLAHEARDRQGRPVRPSPGDATHGRRPRGPRGRRDGGGRPALVMPVSRGPTPGA